MIRGRKDRCSDHHGNGSFVDGFFSFLPPPTNPRSKFDTFSLSSSRFCTQTIHDSFPGKINARPRRQRPSSFLLFWKWIRVFSSSRLRLNFARMILRFSIGSRNISPGQFPGKELIKELIIVSLVRHLNPRKKKEKKKKKRRWKKRGRKMGVEGRGIGGKGGGVSNKREQTEV